MNQLEQLEALLKSYKRVAIAYSGGCDSHFLYEIARRILGNENVLAVLCQGEMMSKEDIDDARALLKNGQYVICDVDVFEIEAFRYNHKDRCYHCKKMIMSTVKKEANKRGFEYVLDGKNLDDEGVYRPGIKACQELGIISPLSLSGFTKQMIRECSQELNIVTYNKPSNACLASRFPYDTILTEDKLKLVSEAERLLHYKGILHCRVRVHDKLARIEVEKQEFKKMINDETLIEEFEKIGFQFITLDLKGITSGSYDK